MGFTSAWRTFSGITISMKTLLLVHGHLWTFNPMQNPSWDAFCGTYNPWYCRSYARFVRFSNKYHPSATPDFGRLPHPVCGFTGFRPDLPAQAAVCWSRTYFLSKIFLFGCNLCNYSASTKHEWCHGILTKQIFRVDWIVKIMKTLVGMFPLHRADIMWQHSLD